MSDPAKAPGRRPQAAFIAAGAASGLLYLSILFSFAFLLPVQVAFGRNGRRSGLAAAGISAAILCVAFGWRLAAAGALSAGNLAESLAVPLVLLGALALVNAPFKGDPAPVYRILAATALCACAALPAIIALSRDASIATYLEGRIGAFLAPMRQAVAGAGDGYEASALAASLDPKDLVAMSIAMLRDSYAAVIFLLIGGSRRLGNRLSGQGSRGREDSGAIDELRLPYPLVWAFLISWSLVLAAEFLRAPEAASAFAWNCALVLSLAYAAQGLGIATHLFKSWNMPKSMRILIAVMAVISLVTPVGMAVAAALPLLGVTEIWIHYRKPKGVGA
jgi:hypothetical protein